MSIDATDVRSNLSLALRHRRDPGIAEQLSALSESTPPPPLRVSGLASCGRKQTFSHQGAKATIPGDESLIAMIQGDWGEDGCRKLLLESGYEFKDAQRELHYSNKDGEEVLRGHIDGLIGIDHGALGMEWALWEMKMMSAFRFKKCHAISNISVSSPDYFTQVQLYMHMLNIDGEPIDKTIFMAVAKDPSAANMGIKGPRMDPIYIEDITYDREVGDMLFQRAEDIYKHSLTGQLWPHERNPSKDWDCSQRFCEFYAQCDPKRTARKQP